MGQRTKAFTLNSLNSQSTNQLRRKKRRIPRFESLEDRRLLTVYVDLLDLTPDGGGCGSLANPCATIQAGVDTALAGEDVIVAGGTYAESVTIAKSLQLRGTGFTTIDPIGPFNGIDIVGAVDVVLENFRVTGADIGIRAVGATSLELHNIDSSMNTKDGIVASSVGSVVIHDSNFDDNGLNGITLITFTSLEAVDVIAASNGGHGLDASFGERVDLAEGFFLDNGLNGVTFDSISNAFGTAIEIEDISALGSGTNGLEITRSGTVELADSLFDGNGSNGVRFDETDTIEVDDITSKSNGFSGLFAKSSGSFRDRDSSYFDNFDHGLELVDTFTSVTLERTSATGNDANADFLGDGVLVRPEDTTMGASDFFVLGGTFSGQVNGINALVVSGTSTITNSLVGGVAPVMAAGNFVAGIRLDEGGAASVIDAVTPGNGNGVAILAYVDAEVENVLATGNVMTGLTVLAPAELVISGGDYSLNGLDGILIDGAGMARVENGDGLTANMNGATGLSSVFNGELKVQGGTFDGNGAEGIFASGTVFVELTEGVTAGANLTGVRVADADALIEKDGVYADNLDHGILLEDIAMFVELTRTTANDNDANSDGTGDGVRASKVIAPMAVGGPFIVQGGMFNDTDAALAGKTQQNGIFVDGLVDLLVVPALTPMSPLDLPVASGNRVDGVSVAGGMFATIMGGTFDLNGGDGISLGGFTGLVDVVSTTASANTGQGFDYSTGGAIVGISGSTFNSNLNGVKVDGATDVFLDNVDAKFNTEMGVTADSISSFSDTNGEYAENGDHGIQLIDVGGPVSLDGTMAVDNDSNSNATGDGVHIEATSGTALAGDLIVSGGSYGSDAFATQRRGIFVESLTGTATVSAANASGNLDEGLRIVDGGMALAITASTFTSNGADGVHISDVFSFSDSGSTYSSNGANGLHLNDIPGAISIGDVTAELNTEAGILIEDTGTVVTGFGVPEPLTIATGAVRRNNDGLRLVNRVGDVIISGLEFSFNDRDNNNVGDGVHITSTVGNPNAIVGSLFVSDTTFLGNPSDPGEHQEKGLYVDSISGGVFIVDSTASFNDGMGVDIEDGGAAVAYAGVVTGLFAGVVSGGSFDNNGDEGLRLNEMTGTVLLQNFNASDNGDEGVEVDASFNIDIANITANRNLLDGLNIASSLDVSIDGSQFNDNADNGVDLFSVDAVSISNTTVLDTGNIVVAALTSGIRIVGATSLDLSNNDIRGSELEGVEIMTVPTVSLTTTTGNVEDALSIDPSRIEHTRSGVAQDDIVHTGIASLTIGTDDSDDVISVTFGATLPAITLAGGEQGFVDELSVVRAMPTDTITVTATTVTDGTSTIAYTEIERVVVDAGDFTYDGSIDGVDIDELVAAIAMGENVPAFELTGDRLVNGDDLGAWLALAGAANLPSGTPFLPGDANLDGAVDLTDLHIWNSNKFTNQAAWTKGDFDASGLIDTADFNIWYANRFSNSAPPNLSGQGETDRGWRHSEPEEQGSSVNAGRRASVSDLVFADFDDLS